jgi:hypothetical protein
MRIAFTGAHRCGKSTLIADLEERLEGYQVIEEPYALLEEDGHEFSHPLSVEDFLAQLTRSLELLEEEEGAQLLFDRCPLDFFGYLMVHPESDAFDPEEWIDRARAAVKTLDLLVFVPIEEPDRIKVSGSEDLALRAEVDAKLRWLLLEDPFHLEVEVLTVHGKQRERVEQVSYRRRSNPRGHP